MSPDKKTGVLTVNLPTVPSDLGPVISDCLFNIRCSLDYLITQLVLVNGNAWGTWNAFPITTNANDFAQAITSRGKRKGRLDGISAQACALIEGLQPYPGRNQALATLNRLHNRDKHSEPALTLSAANNAKVGWASAGSDFLTMIIGDEEMRHGAAFGDIAVDLDAMIAHPDPRFRGIAERFANVKMKGQATLFIAFADLATDELEPFRVDAVLQEILEFVRDTVIPGFEPFFN